MNVRPTTIRGDGDNRLGAARRAARPLRGWRAGFNFTEVLFAVMILGIGFIMVAAIFPVALHQARITGDETAAAQIAKGGANQLEQIALTPPIRDTSGTSATALMDRTDGLTLAQQGSINVPLGGVRVVPGKVFSFRDDRFLNIDSYGDWQRDALWNAVKGNMILPSDTRYAWVGMYRRDGWYTRGGFEHAQPSASPYVQVFVVAVQIRNRSVYEPSKDLRRFPSDAVDNRNPPATLEPALVTATLTNDTNPGGVDRIQVTGGARGRVAPGAVLIISDDNTNPNNAGYGLMNGRIYRVGNPVGNDPANNDTWELAPGNDMATTDPANITNAQVFVVGRSLADPTQPFDASNNPFEGPVQDISVYTSFIYAKQ